MKKESGKNMERIIGVDIDAINITEDREEFKQLMQTIGIGCAPSKTATSYLEGKPLLRILVFRCAFEHPTLGGNGCCIYSQSRRF